MKIYFLQVVCNFNSENHYHYENVYSKKHLAIKQGCIMLEKMFRQEYESMFEENKAPKISRKKLFELDALYDLKITEYDPEYVDSLYDLNKLPIVEEYDIYDLYCADLKPAKIQYSYDYNGKENYISGVYILNYKEKRKEKSVMMHYENYKDSLAGTKFKKGDIVKIKDTNYIFHDKLHVITDVPHKKENQKFFHNEYNVIINHNSFDEGCHVDVFDERELELYTEKLSKDSPIVFLSKYFKGEIKLKNISWMDIECGNITLNENKSFRDIPEIIKQL